MKAAAPSTRELKPKTPLFVAVDILYLTLMLVPLVGVILLKILTTPASEGVSITGAQVFFILKMPFQDMPVTETQLNSAVVILAVLFLCLYLTHGIRKGVATKRSLVAEFIVEWIDNMVRENMGEYFMGFSSFVCAILMLSGLSSLLSLFGIFAPTSDINTTAGWAILVFALITYYKMKCGPWHYVKSFGDPVPFLAPMNVISEVATPFSMAFRHYGNVLSGSIVSVLVAYALQSASTALLGALPVIGSVPIFRIGIPAVVSAYFDIFGGCLQAYIFAMLTMLYVSNGFPMDEFEKRRRKRLAKKESKAKSKSENNN